MHQPDVRAIAKVKALSLRDLEEMGAMGALRRLLRSDRVTLQSVNVHFAGVHGFRRFAAYGTLSVMVDHGDHYDVAEVEFEAGGSAIADERTIDLVTILDDRDIPVAV